MVLLIAITMCFWCFQVGFYKLRWKKSRPKSKNHPAALKWKIHNNRIVRVHSTIIVRVIGTSSTKWAFLPIAFCTFCFSQSQVHQGHQVQSIQTSINPYKHQKHRSWSATNRSRHGLRAFFFWCKSSSVGAFALYTHKSRLVNKIF